MSKQIYKFLNFLDTRDHFVYEGTEQANVTVLILVNYQILQFYLICISHSSVCLEKLRKSSLSKLNKRWRANNNVIFLFAWDKFNPS